MLEAQMKQMNDQNEDILIKLEMELKKKEAKIKDLTKELKHTQGLLSAKEKSSDELIKQLRERNEGLVTQLKEQTDKASKLA